MTLQYHSVPAGTATRDLFTSVRRTLAQPLGRLARVATGALLALVLFAIFGGANSALGQAITNVQTAGSPTPNYGDVVEFTVTLTNGLGVQQIDGYLFSNVYQGFTSVSVTSSTVSSPVSSPVASVQQQGAGNWYVQIQPFTIDPGAVATMVIQATVGAGSIPLNHYLIQATAFNSLAGGGTVSASVTPIRDVDLGVSKTLTSGDATPDLGDNVEFTVTLTNNGSTYITDGVDAATGITVTDVLGAGYSFVSAVPAGGNGSALGGVWTPATPFASGASQTLVVTATVDSGDISAGDYYNSVSITAAGQPDFVPGNDTATETSVVPIRDVDLEVVKVLSSSDIHPAVGDLVDFTVTLTNNGAAFITDGTDAATGIITVTDVLGAGYSLVSAVPGVGNGSAVGGVWTPATPFASGASQTLVVTAMVGAGDIGAGDYDNVATITAAAQEDRVPGNDTDDDTTVKPDGYFSAPGTDLRYYFDGFNLVVEDLFGTPVASSVIGWDTNGAGLVISGNSLFVDYSGGDPVPADGLHFVGTGSSASMRLEGNAAPFGDVIHNFSNDHDGSISVDGTVISYENLAPISDFLVAANKTFDYSLVLVPFDHTIVLNGTGDGFASNSVSFIDCVGCGEEVSFLNPTSNVYIISGDGDDTITANRLDATVPGGFNSLDIDSQDGKDYISVHPSGFYEIVVDGGNPNDCFADVLDLILTGVSGADLTITNPATGTGNWMFTAPVKPVYFTNIENHSDADVGVVLSVTPDLAYATDFTAIVVRVENMGSDMASCVVVNIPPDLRKIFSEDGYVLVEERASYDENGDPVVLTNTYNATTGDWQIAGLGPDFSATFTLGAGLVSNFQLMPMTFPITATANGEDFQEDEFRTSLGFRFPLTTFVEAATFQTRRLADVPVPDPAGLTVAASPKSDLEYEHLIVGIFQGAPGITGAVWCKIPDRALEWVTPTATSAYAWPGDNYLGSPIIGAYPPPAGPPTETLDPVPASMTDLWRPCSGYNAVLTGDPLIDDGDPLVPGVQPRIALPFPLKPNDLFVDVDVDWDGIPGPDGDVIYLATWGSAGLYKSYDGGNSWVAAWPQLGPGDVVAGNYWTNIYAITKDPSGFLFASANDGYVLRSLNHGAAWQTVGPLPMADADTPWSLQARPTPAHAGVVFAGTFGRGVLCTDDWGQNWDVLDGSFTPITNENNLLIAANAGHIFDFAIDDNGDFLIVGTGRGVWRAPLGMGCDLTGPWAFMGPEITLGDGSKVVPEVHALALLEDNVLDATLDGEDDLLAGLWGNFLVSGKLISAYKFETPFGAPVYAPYQLKGVQIQAFATSSDGQVAAITDKGLKFFNPALASVSTAIEDEVTGEIPSAFALEQNYPNPFNPVTTIRYSVAESANIRLAVYDVLGRQVSLLVDGAIQAGQHEVQFDAAGLPSGTYIYRLQTPTGSFSRMLVLMK